MIWPRIALILACTLALATHVLADDGWEPLQGSPSSLSQHPTVRMVSEIVRVVISKKSAKVDCTFVFKNEGKACSVRMRFPDDSSNREGDAPTSVFGYFLSSVDGRKVWVAYNQNDVGWIKTVHFGRGQTRVIKDHYRVRHEILDLESKARTGFGYTLSTGGTWQGNIGRAEIRITFDRASHPGRLRLVDGSKLGTLRDSQPFWARRPGVIAFRTGPSRPKIEGRTLVYVRKNFKPTEKDDIDILFGPLIPAPWLKVN